MPQNNEMQEIPLHEARVAGDLLPPEQYPEQLPDREHKLSRFSNLIRNRRFHIALGIIAALIIMSSAAALGVYLGRRHQRPTFSQAIITPPVITVETTRIVDVITSTTRQSDDPTTFVTVTTCQMGSEHHTKGEGPQYTVDGVYWECLSPSRLSQDAEFEATRLRASPTGLSEG